jgi:hypothetical protein
MESMRSTWTDSRLDDLNGRVSNLADRMDDEFREVRGEIGALHRTLIQFGAAMIAAFVGLIAAVLGLMATQL